VTVTLSAEAVAPGATQARIRIDLGLPAGISAALLQADPVADPAVLRRLADQSRAIFANLGAVGVQDDWGQKTPVIRPIINEARAQRAGLTQGDISKAIAGFFDGADIGVFREGDELRRIILRPVASFRNSVERIRDVQIYSPVAGKSIPIGQVVDRFDIVFEDPKLRRLDRVLTITAQADPAPGVNANDLFAKIRPKVEALKMPAGYKLEWRGQFGNSKDANAGLASTMPIGFGAMILVVFFLFNAVRQPLIIWLTVPLAAIGVVYGLIATGTPMEFMGILAVLSLTGMLIKNAIVLVDETDSQIADGKERLSAIIDASVSRVRPVSLGVLTTVLGVVPLLWDPFFMSLAVVIIAGLSFATVLTLLVVPTLYAIFFRVKQTEAQDGS